MSYTVQIINHITQLNAHSVRYQTPRRLHYRDRVTFNTDGTLFFERFNYGESAGLVFTLNGTFDTQSDTLNWDYASCSYCKESDVPHVISAFDENTICFDDKLRTPWELDNVDKSALKKTGGFFKKLFTRK